MTKKRRFRRISFNLQCEKNDEEKKISSLPLTLSSKSGSFRIPSNASMENPKHTSFNFCDLR